jgi:2-polyprenyl-3-methyl-5-hydroxy-6-metoxy-1,4-benzoquinol methylase
MKEANNYYKQARPEVISFVPTNIRSILDVGCGEGTFLKLVKEKTGAETWGIEVINEVAEIAKTNIDRIFIGNVEEVLNSIPDTYFDCITFNDVLEHLVDPAEILKKVKSKLSKNGIVVASIPNVRYIYNLYDIIIKKDWEYKDSGILDYTHYRFFTKKSAQRMFEGANYKILHQGGINANRTWYFRLFNVLTLGIFNDTKYLEFISIAKLKDV